MQSEGTSGKTSASGPRGMGFNFQADQIFHTLPITRHRCKFEVWPWHKASDMDTAHF